jgi:general nucleoside transport system permease protein
MLAALFIGAVLLLFLKANPFQAYAALVQGALGNVSGLTQSLVKATPLLFVGLGICIAFRASVINIGAEGQIILGALMGTWFALAFRTWPGWLLVPATLTMSFLAGAAWGFVPGLLKARLAVNEILSTVMMNAIAVQLMNLQLRRPLMDPKGISAGTFLAQSERLPEQAWLPRLVPQTQLHAGAILAVVLAVAVYIFLWRTTIGYRIRAVGLNPDAARYAAINVPFYQALSLTLAGGFAGLAGASLSISLVNLFQENLTAGQGFIAVALVYFGGWRPAGIMGGALLFSAVNAFQLWMQVLGVDIKSDVAVMLPYLLTIAALAVTANRAHQPAALNLSFERGES